MLHRQRIIVGLIRGHSAAESRLGLVKLSFLLRQESPTNGGGSFYDFVPYRFGPYSFTLNHELQHLSRDGLVDFQGQYGLSARHTTATVRNGLPPRLEQDIDWTLKRYSALTANDLLDYVYQTYPWFTVNSKRRTRRRQERPKAALGIYTAGYEKQPVDRFLDLLMSKGIERIIDVRNNPISRRYGYHKSTLSKLARSLGFEYCHLPNLGIPSQQRNSNALGNDLEFLFATYREKILPAHPKDLRQLAVLISEKPSVLVCIEADPTQCHRFHLATELEQVLDLPIVHLGWPR